MKATIIKSFFNFWPHVRNFAISDHAQEPQVLDTLTTHSVIFYIQLLNATCVYSGAGS